MYKLTTLADLKARAVNQRELLESAKVLGLESATRNWALKLAETEWTIDNFEIIMGIGNE